MHQGAPHACIGIVHRCLRALEAECVHGPRAKWTQTLIAEQRGAAAYFGRIAGRTVSIGDGIQLHRLQAVPRATLREIVTNDACRLRRLDVADERTRAMLVFAVVTGVAEHEGRGRFAPVLEMPRCELSFRVVVDTGYAVLSLQQERKQGIGRRCARPCGVGEAGHPQMSEVQSGGFEITQCENGSMGAVRCEGCGCHQRAQPGQRRCETEYSRSSCSRGGRGQAGE